MAMAKTLLLEQSWLVVSGVSMGTCLGVGLSRLFIPFLQTGEGRHSAIPPFEVIIAWGDILTVYLAIGMILAGIGLGMLWFLVRLKLFEAIKLGDAA